MSGRCCDTSGYYPGGVTWTPGASLHRGSWMPYPDFLCPGGVKEGFGGDCAGCGKYATGTTMYTPAANVSPTNTRTDRSVALSSLVEGFRSCRGLGGEGDYSRLHGTWTG